MIYTDCSISLLYYNTKPAGARSRRYAASTGTRGGGQKAGTRFMSQARARDTIEAMRAAVPPGQARLTAEARRVLAEGTRSLLAAVRPGGGARAVPGHPRARTVPARGRAESWMRATILVTGGTGCVGEKLIGHLAGLGPAAWSASAGASRRPTPGTPTPSTGMPTSGTGRPERADDRDPAGSGLPRGRPARPRPGRDRGAPDGDHQRARHPQRAGGGRSRPACRRWCAPRPARRCGPTPRTCTPPPSAPPNGWPRRRPRPRACWSRPAGSPTCWTTRSSTCGCDAGPRTGGGPAAQPGHRVLRAVGPGVGAAAAAGGPGRRPGSSGSTRSPTWAGRSACWISRWRCWPRRVDDAGLFRRV